ncbi:MAG: L-lactate dehydrogenase [Mycoplasma sp.]|nr:L-lactate dehydrogenase [Mycoplasma sp.]
MEIKSRKIALIGAGAVGTSFLFSAMNRGVADEYTIIDVNNMAVEGNKLDLEDASPTNFVPWKTRAVNYDDFLNGKANIDDCDIIVICAGRPQKPGETRLNMIGDNIKIMSTIANAIKKTAFDGITIIASNPVDILTTAYQNITGYKSNKVIGSGTSLDTARLRFELSSRIGVAPTSISAYVAGEHGDSSVSVFSSASVSGKPLQHFLEKNNISNSELKEIHEIVYKKAYNIIEKKRATFYGIGSSLANIAHAVLRDTNEILAVGAKLNGEYGYEGLYVGTPAIINKDGIAEIIELDMNSEEKEQFDKSVKQLDETYKNALADSSK